MMYHCWELKLSWVTLPAHSSRSPRRPGRSRAPPDVWRPPVEHAPADLGGDHEADEEVEQEQTGLRGRLAQGDLGVLAGEEEHRDEGQHGDAEDEVLDQEGPDPEDAHLHEGRPGAELDEVEHDQEDQAGGDAQADGRVAPTPRWTTAGTRRR
jgi:hypothetical protein